MNRSDTASSGSVRRSRRPQTRLDTSSTRTGRPRKHLPPNPAAGRREKARAVRPACTSPRSHTAAYYRGITRTKTEPRWRRVRREGCGSRRTLFHLARTRRGAGLRVFHGWASVRTSDTLGRYPSEIRTGCANERTSGSARGAISNDRPYRDPVIPITCVNARSLV
jgi:hypothetical protein